MHAQWKRFQRLLCVAIGLVWVFCSLGILLVPAERFWVRMGLFFMLGISTFYGAGALYFSVHRARELSSQMVRPREPRR